MECNIKNASRVLCIVHCTPVNVNNSSDCYYVPSTLYKTLCETLLSASPFKIHRIILRNAYIHAFYVDKEAKNADTN